MNKRNFMLTTLFSLYITTASATDFYIEDESLTAIPQDAVNAIKNADAVIDGLNKPCEYIGKKIDLDMDGNASDLAITTNNTCAWGAALGPILILRHTAQRYWVVIDDGGFSLTLGKSKGKGLRDVTISHGAAGHSGENLWVYNGSKYVKKSMMAFAANKQL